ncbi:MAG: azurin [Verrucomicrobiales bacterium]|jgi:azurin
MIRLTILIFLAPAAAWSQNLADPAIHPYADPANGREPYRLADETVNEARLYDFYQRQADYYMAQPEAPAILPAYPGLDANLHGHWGKHNQNNHTDGRWNDMDFGRVLGCTFVHEQMRLTKAVVISLGENQQLSTVFDPLTLTYRAVWEDGFVSFPPFRWALARGTEPVGNIWFKTDDPVAEDSKYLGYSRHGDRVVFRYVSGKTEVLDSASATGAVFERRLEFPRGGTDIRIPLPAQLPPLTQRAIRGTGIEGLSMDGNTVTIAKAARGASFEVFLSVGESTADHKTTPLQQLLDGGSPSWPDKITLKGKVTKGYETFLVDEIPIPFENPHKATMHLSGIAFLPNGDALVCSLHGDVWKVSGLNLGLEVVSWKRFATGLHQPFGIHIDDDGIFVLGRDQLTRLHDLNDDDEADFYENIANDFGGYGKSHTHVFGLERTADGVFHFVARDGIFQAKIGEPTQPVASGVRNCMGTGSSPDGIVLVAPQEGTWTPASAIIEVRQGEFYGLARNKGAAPPAIAPPLCFVPRGIDNSTGGMVHIDSRLWGPMQGSFVGLSYGYGSQYLILRDDSGKRPQGAIVPLEGEFKSGVVRGKFHPSDGHLYVVGTDGWGNYAVDDGCFQRVRYTGKPLHRPIGFKVSTNGIRLDFAEKLAPENATDPANYFIQQWNYEYADRYGSPEFSVNDPETLGHDRLQIRTALPLDDGRSVFLEIPDLKPAMQLHIRMHLADLDQTEFKADIFPTLLDLNEPFYHDDLPVPDPDKPTTLTLRVRAPGNLAAAGDSTSGKPLEGARKIEIKVNAGLQFETKLLTAKAGESLALTLLNEDVMPHNLVIVSPGAARKVGELSFAMLNDPKAGEKHYVPASAEVLAFTHVINPGQRHTTNFRAPETPGDYPFVCTFPGHWQVMQGVFRVEP